MRLESKTNNFHYNHSYEMLQNELDYIKKYIEKYDILSDIDKYDLLNHFIDFRFNTNDIVNLVNYYMRCNYTRIIDIPTTFETDFRTSEGHGKDFSWEDIISRIILVCATHDSYVLEKETYSYVDIMSLIKDKTVYPIYLYYMRLNNYSDKKEELTLDKLNNINTLKGHVIELEEDEYGYWDNKLIIKPKKEYIPFFTTFLEKTISKEELFSLIKNYIYVLLDYEEERLDTHEEEEIYNELKEYYNNNFKGRRLIKKIK